MAKSGLVSPIFKFGGNYRY